MFRTRLSRSSPAISKSNRFPVVLPLLDLNSVISNPPPPHPLLEVFSTDSPVGPFVGSDDHLVRVVNINGNACRQTQVHWLLARLVIYKVRLRIPATRGPAIWCNGILQQVFECCNHFSTTRPGSIARIFCSMNIDEDLWKVEANLRPSTNTV